MTTELLTWTPELNEDEASSRIVGKREAKSIEFDGNDEIRPIAFVADEYYIVGGDGDKIRRWRVKDGKEVGQPMDAESLVRSIAVSRGGKWIVSGAAYGQVTVWGTESHKKVIQFAGHNYCGVWAVDVSPDGSKIATGSNDWTVCLWSLSTGERLLDPFKHDWTMAAVKFSPDGRSIATATWLRKSVRIYDTQDGRKLVDAPIQVGSYCNQSLAWVALGKELLALSKDGEMHRIDVATGSILSKWAIHGSDKLRCIALPSNGAFVSASDHSSALFWDIATHNQIGPLIRHPDDIFYMAISANYDLVISGRKKTLLRGLRGVLPSSYFDNVCVLSSMPNAEKTDSLRTTYSNPKPCARGKKNISTTFSRIFLMISPDMLQSPAVFQLRREAMGTSTKVL